MRNIMGASVVVLSACHGINNGVDAPPDPKGWTITVDMSALDRFVPPTSASWSIGGRAIATNGLVNIDTNGMPVAFDASGAFATDVPVQPGLIRIPILATDAEGHTRRGDRTLIDARVLAPDAMNPDAAALVLTDAILATMGQSLAGSAGSVDIASQILAQPTLSDDGQCTTWPTAASQGTPTVHLRQSHTAGFEGQLVLDVIVPDISVSFDGVCAGPLRDIPLQGGFSGDVVITTVLTPATTQPTACLTALEHGDIYPRVDNWQFGVWGVGGPLQNWIVSAFSGDKSAEARDQLAQQVGDRAGPMLDAQLRDVSVFDRTSELDFLGSPVAMQLCVADLELVGHELVAKISARTSTAMGDDSLELRGTPMIDGAPTTKVAAGEVMLDANLVGQMLASAWKAGGLRRPGPDVDIGALEILTEGLYERHPNATTAQVAIDAELPALVRAMPDGPGDIRIEIPDLMLELSVEGEKTFRFGVVLLLDVDLVPTDGVLVPKVVGTTAQVALLDELLDGNDAALEQAVTLQIGGAAASLFEGVAGIALPDLPGLGKPSTVRADAGGRFLHVTLK